MRISLAYSRPERPLWLHLDLPEGSTVRDAIERSGVLAQCPEIDLARNKVGIFGKVTKLDAVLSEGSRVEIYRPITADPRTVPRRDLAGDEDEDD